MLLAITFVLLFGMVWSDTNVDIPKLNESEWWGPDELIGNEDTSIRSFRVEFNDSMVHKLLSRLKSSVYSESLTGVGCTYGFNTALLPSWISYVSEEYPFSEREDFLNEYPQYKTRIQGLDIHFIRAKSNKTNGLKVVPLLMLHGWPGSVREFYETIPLLTSTASGYNFTFEIIAPSLPGFGYSDGTLKPGLAPPQMAVIFKNFMERIGFDQFYIYSGDFGSVIASNMATLYPDVVLGQHTNLPFVLNYDIISKLFFGQFFPDAVVEPELASRLYPLNTTFEYVLENFGYFHLQATRPDSIGIALADSPVGLLSYVLEKFATFANGSSHLPDEDCGLSQIGISKEKLIDNLMYYWSTNSIMSSIRLYAEYSSKKNFNLGLDTIPTEVPTWLLQAQYEILYEPAKILKNKYPNLLGATVLDYGGHFFALQFPDEFSADVFKAVNAFIKWREAHSD